jgi:hypothetical protein
MGAAEENEEEEKVKVKRRHKGLMVMFWMNFSDTLSEF